MSKKNPPQVFQAYRAIGLFCDHVPFAIQRQGDVHFVACSIDKTFQIYNSDKLDIVQVGGQHEDSIKAIAVKNTLTFTASGSDINIWHRSTLKARLSAHRSAIDQLVVFGDHLLSSSRSDHVVHIWDYRRAELFSKVEIEDYLHVSVVMHPYTYLNKVLIATIEGQFQLWNLKSNKCIYRFKGWNSAITVIEQSPVVDVVAIGLEDGRIILHNLKLDKTLFVFEQTEGAVTTLSFRSDAGFQHLVSGSKVGTIAIWDLEKKKLVSLMSNVHEGPVSRAYFFQNEPILLTSGSDNSLNIWIFDQTDGSARLLKSRSGHSQPPVKIKFYSTSSQILSGGQDQTFRFFSTVRDQRSREISQGHIQSKINNKNYQGNTSNFRLKPIVDFDFNLTKQKQWDNLLSCHRGSSYAVTWNKQNLVIGKHKLKSTSQSVVTAVAISACGNYGIIGSQNGAIDKYNIQSGIFRGAYPDSQLMSKEEVASSAHTGTITGLAVDAVNRFLISSSLDGSIKFWNFNDGTLVKDVQLGCGVTQIVLQKDSSLLAAVSDDFIIHVFDIDTQVCVRRLIGHTALITDLTFSGDARWIVSASGDSSLRVWDLPTGHCVDWVTMKSPIVSLTMSPRGDFLATSHVDSRGIFLWANQNFFTNLFLQPVTAPHPVEVALPVIEGLVDGDEIQDEEGQEQSEKKEMEIDDRLEKSDEEMSEDDIEDDNALFQELITLSKAPKSKWRTLINLDLINERNKPEKAPETPKAAPFFLPTLPGVRTKFLAAPEESIDLPESKKLDMSKLRPTTAFVAELHKCFLKIHSASGKPAQTRTDPELSYQSVASMLKTMSPSAIDFEINSLSIENDFAEITLVLRFILDQFQRNINYELAQAILNILLKHHGEVISEANSSSTEVASLLNEIEKAQSSGWERIQSLFHNNLCLINYFSNLQS